MMAAALSLAASTLVTETTCLSKSFRGRFRKNMVGFPATRNLGFRWGAGVRWGGRAKGEGEGREKWINPSEEDIEKVRGMLGRTPMGTWMIHSYCDSNRTHPQVLKVHPLMRRKKRGDLTPMPTLYWLCCPHYQYWISRLEGEGYIEKVNSLLENNESMAQAFHNNNKRYIDQRWDLLSESERKFVAERSTVQDRLLRSGIGGSANLRRIRCLHENFAHFLATEDNVVGEYISSLGLIPPCPTCTEAAATEKNHNS